MNDSIRSDSLSSYGLCELRSLLSFFVLVGRVGELASRSAASCVEGSRETSRGWRSVLSTAEDEAGVGSSSWYTSSAE